MSRASFLQESKSWQEQWTRSCLQQCWHLWMALSLPGPTRMGSRREGSSQHPSAKASWLVQLQKQKASLFISCTSKEQLEPELPPTSILELGELRSKAAASQRERFKSRHLSRQEAAQQVLHGFSHCSEVHSWVSLKPALLGPPPNTWLWRGCSCAEPHWCLTKPLAPGQGHNNPAADVDTAL